MPRDGAHLGVSPKARAVEHVDRVAMLCATPRREGSSHHHATRCSSIAPPHVRVRDGRRCSVPPGPVRVRRPGDRRRCSAAATDLARHPGPQHPDPTGVVGRPTRLARRRQRRVAAMDPGARNRRRHHPRRLGPGPIGWDVQPRGRHPRCGSAVRRRPTRRQHQRDRLGLERPVVPAARPATLLQLCRRRVPARTNAALPRPAQSPAEHRHLHGRRHQQPLGVRATPPTSCSPGAPHPETWGRTTPPTRSTPSAPRRARCVHLAPARTSPTRSGTATSTSVW